MIGSSHCSSPGVPTTNARRSSSAGRSWGDIILTIQSIFSVCLAAYFSNFGKKWTARATADVAFSSPLLWSCVMASATALNLWQWPPCPPFHPHPWPRAPSPFEPKAFKMFLMPAWRAAATGLSSRHLPPALLPCPCGCSALAIVGLGMGVGAGAMSSNFKIFRPFCSAEIATKSDNEAGHKVQRSPSSSKYLASTALTGWTLRIASWMDS
mmetsp:Transcript_121180/g.342881  ORF Transcript_121180/g.342881 Transcript_121180/m.342881 type:complete len:211 (+) Transcript_121180:1376-2008(+)